MLARRGRQQPLAPTLKRCALACLRATTLNQLPYTCNAAQQQHSARARADRLQHPSSCHCRGGYPCTALYSCHRAVHGQRAGGTMAHAHLPRLGLHVRQQVGVCGAALGLLAPGGHLLSEGSGRSTGPEGRAPRQLQPGCSSPELPLNVLKAAICAPSMQGPGMAQKAQRGGGQQQRQRGVRWELSRVPTLRKEPTRLKQDRQQPSPAHSSPAHLLRLAVGEVPDAQLVGVLNLKGQQAGSGGQQCVDVWVCWAVCASTTGRHACGRAAAAHGSPCVRASPHQAGRIH